MNLLLSIAWPRFFLAIALLGLALAEGIASPAAADTFLSGPISGTLTPTGNPHRVTGSISVTAGDTLHIEAGCDLLFAAATSFDVSGRLETAGTTGQRVDFAPEVPMAPAGSWAGVTFFSGSSGDVVGLDVDGAETALHVLGGIASVRDVRFDRSAKYGLRVDVGGVTVQDAVVSRAGESGPSWAGLFVGGGNPQFERCRVEDCAGTGVGVWAPAFPTLVDCTIERCRSGVTSVGASPHFERCTVRDHGIPGDFDSGAGFFVGYASGTPVLVDCTIESNFFGVAIINDGSIDLGDLSDLDPANNGGNVFRANDTFDGVIRHVWNGTPNPVKAEGNAWTDGAGAYASDPATIDSWIFDDEELAGMAAVDFDPISTATAVPGGLPETGLPPAGAAAATSWKVLPTPVRSGALLQGVLPAPGHLQADLIDVAGRRVKTLDLGRVGSGTLSRPLDLRGIAPGAYFVRIRRDGHPSGTARLVRVH